MKIILNGKPKEFSQDSRLDTVISEFCKDRRHIIAEVNGVIIRAAHWPETLLQEGDVLELIGFVGGG